MDLDAEIIRTRKRLDALEAQMQSQADISVATRRGIAEGGIQEAVKHHVGEELRALQAALDGFQQRLDAMERRLDAPSQPPAPPQNSSEP